MAGAAKKEPKDKGRDGKAIKVSSDVMRHLTDLKAETKEPYDAVLRRHFGLPAKNGHPQPLRSYFVIDSPKDLIVTRDLREAKGQQILLAVRRGERRTDHQKKDEIIQVRELP